MNRYEFRYLAHASALFLLSSLLLFCASCSGGGSEGTGGITLEGSITTKSGQAFSNANILLEETGEEATTDTQGQFVLRIREHRIGDLSLRLKERDISLRVIIGRLRDDTVRARIEIIVDRAARTAEISRLDEFTTDAERDIASD